MYISTCSKLTNSSYWQQMLTLSPSLPSPKIKINNKVDLFFFFFFSSFDSCSSLKLKRHFLKTELERIQTCYRS